MRCGRAGIAGYGLTGAVAALGALLLAGCAGQLPAMAPEPMVQTAAPPPQQPNMTPAELQEHQRILASYGGVYSDPRLQAMVEQLVERLVAASDRPDLHYKVTMLNSETVNAFALPTGQLYVTRGLISLANDQSELASVIGHEMGHVIARHAELRERKIRDEELNEKVFTNLVSDPQASAMALARSKLSLASCSQKQELDADAGDFGDHVHGDASDAVAGQSVTQDDERLLYFVHIERGARLLRQLGQQGGLGVFGEQSGLAGELERDHRAAGVEGEIFGVGGRDRRRLLCRQRGAKAHKDRP